MNVPHCPKCHDKLKKVLNPQADYDIKWQCTKCYELYFRLSDVEIIKETNGQDS
jgi:uncharacterized protein with PIN domain